MKFSLKVTTALAIGVICIKSFTKLTKTFLNYAPNVLCNVRITNMAMVRFYINNKKVTNSVIRKLITDFAMCY